MGLTNKPFFVLTMAVVACLFRCGSISASPLPLPEPARRALDSSPTGLNNVSPVQRPQEFDATIKEVEGLLQADSSLPRLTRGEILDIIENLTRADMQKEIVRDPKAIMVVLPYSAENAQNGDVQALYTKPPMTHIVQDGTGDEHNRPILEIPQKKRRPTKKPYPAIYDGDTESVKVAKVPTTETEIFKQGEMDAHESFQQLQSAQELATQKPKTTTENPFTRFINRRRKTTKLPSNHKQEFHDVSTTTATSTTTTTGEPSKMSARRKVTRKPTTKTTTTTLTVKPFEFIPDQGIRIINPPPFQPTHGQPSVAQVYPILNESTSMSRATTPKVYYAQPKTTTVTPAPIMVDEIQIPEDFKNVLKSLDILIKQSPTQPPNIDDDSPMQDQLSEQDKLKVLFASLGGQTSTTTTSATIPEPDVMQVANNLTPEMKDLLMTFGLIPDPNKDETTTQKIDTFMEPSSVISPESYSSFKPLPVSSNAGTNKDMENFLAEFGLLDRNKPSGLSQSSGSNRGQKAISMSKQENALHPNLHVIHNGDKDIFPVSAELEKPQSDNYYKEHVPVTKPSNHVFNPANSGAEYATEDEIKRVNELMGVIKQFEKLNGTATEDDLKHIDLEGLKDLINSFNVPLDQQKGPNPLDYDVGLLKNEVKRQTSTTEKSTELVNPTLALLEESFGGSPDSALEVTNIETTTIVAPSKTGFYYLLDWNSFFDIDNQKGKRVNLRFQPKVGDPKRFLSVNVP